MMAVGVSTSRPGRVGRVADLTSPCRSGGWRGRPSPARPNARGTASRSCAYGYGARLGRARYSGPARDRRRAEPPQPAAARPHEACHDERLDVPHALARSLQGGIPVVLAPCVTWPTRSRARVTSRALVALDARRSRCCASPSSSRRAHGRDAPALVTLVLEDARDARAWLGEAAAPPVTHEDQPELRAIAAARGASSPARRPRVAEAAVAEAFPDSPSPAQASPARGRRLGAARGRPAAGCWAAHWTRPLETDITLPIGELSRVAALAVCTPAGFHASRSRSAATSRRPRRARRGRRARRASGWTPTPASRRATLAPSTASPPTVWCWNASSSPARATTWGMAEVAARRPCPSWRTNRFGAPTISSACARRARRTA